MSDFDPNGILRTLGPSGIMDPVRNLKVAAEMRAQEEATAEQARIAGRVDMASWMAPTLTQLSPETIMSISENPLATDADLEALSGAEQQLLVENYGQTLVSQLGAARSDKERWDIWSETPTELQFILEEAGIPVPQKPSESGIWGTNVLRRLAGAVTPGTDWGKGDLGQGTKLGSWSQDKAAVLGKKISPVGDVAGTLFKVLDYPVELGLRVDRTMQSAGLPGIGAAVSPFGMIAESAENALDPSKADDSWFNLKRAVGDLPRVWREAGDKNGTFDPSVVARATEALDGDGQKLALALEMAENPTDLLGIAERLSGQTRGTAEFAEAYAGVQALSMDEKFMATVDELSRTRMSFGRDFADNSVLGLADRVLSDGTHFAANSTFGQINGALAEMGLFFVIDPTMAVSKLHRVRKIASLGVDSSRMSHELNKLQGFADLGRRLDEGEEIADVASEIRRLEFGRDVELVAEAAPNLRQNLTSRILTASDAKRIERGRQVDRQFAEFADALNEVEGARTLGQLIQDQPKYAKLLTALESVHQTEPIRNADDVWEAVKSTTNVRAMLSTSSAGRDPRIFRLPSLTAKEAKVARTESWFKKTIDWGTPEASKLDEQLTDLSRRLRNDEIGFEDYAVAKEAMVADRWSNLGTVAKFRQKSIEGLQNVAHSFTQHVPRETTVIETAARGETISEIADAGAAAVDFSRLANFGQKFGVPRQVVDEYVDLFAKGSTGERMTYVRLFLGELLTETGFMDDGMRAIYDDFVRKSNHFYHGGPELADNWRYSDLLDDSAIWTKQLSDQVSIPAWTDIVKAKFRTTATRQIAGAPIDFLDRAMNKVWKPLVLMRIGFITRAAGEETASFMLRLGSGTYLKSVLARNATGFRTDAVTGEVVSATDLGALANTLQGVTHKMAGWAKVRYDEDLVQLARQTMSATEKSEVRRLYSAADEAFRIGDEARWKELFDEAAGIEEKFIDAYIDTLPKRSQFVMDVNQWAQSKAATMTPAYREFIDESWFGKIIPDRTTMARRILGVGDDLTVDRMNHVWMTAGGDSARAFSSNERLVAAHYAMMTNPTTARLMARDVAQTIGPAYVPGGLDTNIGIEQMLTEQRNLIVATKANGRRVVQEMRPFRNEFGILHQRDEGFIEATGNMMLRSFNDPVIRDSGALEILGTHIGGRTKANLDTLGIELDELNRMRRNIRVDVRNPALNFLRDRTAGIHSVDRAKLTEVFGRLDNLDPDEMIWMQQRGAEIADLIEKNGLSRAMLFHPNPKTLARDLRTGSIEATMTEVQQAMQSFVRRPDYFVSQQELARAAQAVKRPFARPAGRYAVPLYSPMIDSKFSGRFTELISNDPELKSAWIADVTANLVERGSVTDTEFTSLIDELVQMRPGQGDGMVTLGGLSFTDPRNAEIVADATNEFVRRVGIEDFWGPDRAGAMDFMGAGPAAKLGGATEMGPIAGVGRVEAGTHQLGKLYPKVGESGKFYRSSSVPYEVLPPESRTVFIELDDGRWIDRAEYQADPDLYTAPRSNADEIQQLTERVKKVQSKKPRPTGGSKAFEPPELKTLEAQVAELEKSRPKWEPSKPTLDPAYVKEMEAYDATRARYEEDIIRADARVTELKAERPSLQTGTPELARWESEYDGLMSQLHILRSDRKIPKPKRRVVFDGGVNPEVLEAQRQEMLDRIRQATADGADDAELAQLHDELYDIVLKINSPQRGGSFQTLLAEHEAKLADARAKVEAARGKIKQAVPASIDPKAHAAWGQEVADAKAAVDEALSRSGGGSKPTGKVEWVNGASEELGLRELNKLRTEKLRELFTASPDTIGYSDEVFTDQIQALINGVFDSNYHPGLIPPDEVRDAFGPIMAARIPENFGMWNKLVRGWFQGVVDPAMTRIIRTPHYAANMASAMPFADDLYRFQITGAFNDEFIKGEHFVTDDTVAAIHARWFSDSEDLLTSGDEIDEAIWRLREGTIHEDPQAAELLGINLKATFGGKKMKPETIAGRAKAWAHMRAEAYSSAIESASIRATDLTVEFIDDHRYRSQFQSTIRNIVPFWFAEEQFLKRQFRMLAQSPEAIRKGMLFMDGMRHTGMIVQDGEGNELFAYPGTETLNRFILQHTGKVFGFEAMAAFAQPMTTNVDFMLPGVTPSNPVGSYLPNTNTSPMVGVPLTMMTDRFPELGFIEDRLLGNRAGQDPIQQLLPSSAQRLVSAFGVGAFGADRLASSQMRAMQALEIANLGPPENATPMEMQEYTDRVRNYARILNVVDFTLYASAPLPSGAAVRFEDLEISKEFREIMFESGLDRNEAFALFVEKYPDHTALNVFTNQNVTGATIPQTQAGHDFLIDNQELLINHPHAAAWLTPPIDGTSDDAWSRRANEQLYETELRNKLAPEQYLQEIYIREAMPGYYDMIEQFQLAIFTARTEDEADALELELADRKKRYLEMHPVFADSLGRNSSRYAQRKQDRDAILAMPREELPEGEHVDQVLNLMVSYAQFEREMAVMTNDNSQAAQAQRKNLRDSFYAWARQYVRDFPAADSYFQSVIRLDSILGGVETEFTYEYGS